MFLFCITAGFTRDCCSKVDIFIMECEMQQPQCATPQPGCHAVTNHAHHCRVQVTVRYLSE